MKDLKQYYCEVTQEEATEAKELLVKAGEDVWGNGCWIVVKKYKIIQFDSKWLVSYVDLDLTYIQTTYPQFKQMLIDKIKDNESN